jgi:hypothetical protein
LRKNLERLAASSAVSACGEGTLWRGSQEPRETRLKEAGTERRQSALRSLAYLRVGSESGSGSFPLEPAACDRHRTEDEQCHEQGPAFREGVCGVSPCNARVVSSVFKPLGVSLGEASVELSGAVVAGIAWVGSKQQGIASLQKGQVQSLISATVPHMLSRCLTRSCWLWRTGWRSFDRDAF